MESLYTKYRPQTFEQVVGQAHVVETLKRAVLEGRTSHAYLFCGPRGTGKTTMARILAKALMCERGPAALPDGTCEQCRLIASGEHPDVIELDAASRTGVDNVREEIISRVSYAPAMGRCKVYIIDEVHMLTTAAFNALLKTLEEPPEHVVFIMCTTDPQKILATILSRVQRFDFHAIGNDEMQAHLAYVCRQEGFTYDEAALELIVRHARGGMRDALTSLEQLSVFGSGGIDLASATDFLGEVSGSVLGKLSRAMAHRDVGALFSEVGALADAGRDLLQLARELSAHVRDVYVVAAVPSADDVVAARGDELEALRAEAAAYGSVDRLARVLSILGDASGEMRTATNQRLVLEVALTKIARPAADLTLDSLAERVADLERQVAILAAPRPAAGPAADADHGQAPAPIEAPSVKKTAPEPPAPVPVPSAEGGAVSHPAPARPAAPPAPEGRAPGNAAPSRPDPSAGSRGAAGAPSGAVAAPRGGGHANGNLQRLWKQVVDQLVAQVPAKGSLLLSSTAVSDDGEKLMVSLPKGSHFAARMLERSDVRASVDPVVAAAFGPRQVVYVESSLAGAEIARAGRAPAPASRPAPQPTTAPRPAQQPAPAPAATAPQPAPAPPAYPMPWDEPPAPAPAADDVVPYDDADAAVYEEVFEPDVPLAAERPVAPRPAAPAALDPVSVGGAPVPAGASPDAGEESGASPRAMGEGPGGGVEQQELTPEFASIASMLADAFGQPLSMSVETAVSTSDEDAAEELSYDEGPELDEGYTDDPVDDEDDED